MAKKDISKCNATWGICGFTSALTHLYNSDSRLKRKIDSTDEENTRLGLLIEVMTFLKYVKAFHRDLINGLNKLNKDLDSETMKQGINAFLTAAEKAVRSGEKIGNSNKYQCALTPEALTLYLKKICGYTAAKLTKGADPGKQGILGLVDKDDALKHWVYRGKNGNVYNWGYIIPKNLWKTHEKGLGHPAFHHVGYHISIS